MVSSHGCFVWYELTTTDAETAKAFYADVVGWGLCDASMPGAAYTLFTAGEVAVAGLIGLPAEARKMGAQPRWTGYVGVDDVDAATDRFKRLGGTVYVPPTDVPDVSRFSVVADPQAATLALVKWLNPGQEQSAAPTLPGHVGWHALSAVNWKKAFAFYGELFGWQKEVDADVVGIDTYQLFSAAGQTIGSMSTKPPTVPMPFWLYYFNVGDIDAAVERVKAGGGKILEGPVDAPGDKRIARCTDPQGAMFALTGAGRRTIGYFGSVAADDPAATRLFVPKKAGPYA
jgi:predicted enzyme related to lactoylglutathione lyase